MTSKKEILVAMSGGVDSSVTAALLKQAGYEVTGVFMCLGQEGAADSATSGCCSPQDAADARLVAHTLGIGLYVLNLGDQFSQIVDYFIDDYSRGRTPNPCVRCNSQIKFGRLIEYANSLGIDKIATGHYARITKHQNQIAIARKAPRNKDQSYVLFEIDRKFLSQVVFPLGEFDDKAKVREIARDLGLKVHDKPDSQEVCFVPENDYADFLLQKRPGIKRPGKILHSNGETLGVHEGVFNFTIGQRKGLGISFPTPLYVNGIDPVSNIVTVGPMEDVMRNSLRAENANWHVDMPLEFRATVQIRYNHQGAEALVKRTSEGEFEVEFDEPVFAITPGQAAVCYDGDVMLGGGWIH